MKKLFNLMLLTLVALQAWAVAPEEGKIYKIVSPTRGNLKIAEDILEHTVYCPIDLNGKVYQYWILEKSGNLWTIKNAYTGRYLQNHNTFYQSFTTGTNAATFDIIENTGVGPIITQSRMVTVIWDYTAMQLRRLCLIWPIVIHPVARRGNSSL